MKILLVNPPWKQDDRTGVRAGSRWPHLKIPEEERYMPFPFYLAYATALLKKNNINAKAIDAISENLSYNEFEKKVKKFSPDLLFSEVSTPSLIHDLKLLKKLKENNKCLLAISGPDINIRSKLFLEKHEFIDFVFVGEYEHIILEVAKKLKLKEFNEIKGIIFRNKNEIIINEKRPLLKELDSLPWPDRNDFPMFNYHDCHGGIPEPSAQMWASRGCPYQCTFCAWPQLMYEGSNYRTRNVDNVVNEIEFLVKKKGFRSIYFDDDTFNIGKKRMIDFGNKLKKKNLRIPWAFMGRADLSDKETLSVLRNSGLHAVKYGMESGVQRLVDNANKNLNLKKAIKNILATKELGIKIHLTFTFGLPGETKQTIRQTINLVKFLNPDSVQFSITTPFPGTKFYEKMKKEGKIISNDWNEYDGNTKSVIKTNDLSAIELKAAQDFAYKEWYNFKHLTQRYSKLSPFNLFIMCLKENGPKFTVIKTFKYIKNKHYNYFLKNYKKEKIQI